MPGVVIGHNQDIAWGMTNLGADVTDLYLEKVTADALPLRRQAGALHDPRGDHQGRRRREPRRSPSGPPATARCVSDRDDELANVGKTRPRRQRGPRPRRRLRGRAALDRAGPRPTPWTRSSSWTRAKDFTEFRKAAARLRGPLAEPDLRRHQGQHRLPGARPDPDPRQGRGDGARRRAPGWDPRYQWTGLHPVQTELPYEYNPKRGYIVTANQAVVDQEKYPYLLTKDWGYGTRSQRINDLIESKIKDGGKISTDDMQAMQMDNSSEIAKLLVPYLLKIDIKDKLRPRGPAAAGGLGLHPGRRLRGGRVLQRRLAQHPQARLRRQAAQGAAGRGPVPAACRPADSTGPADDRRQAAPGHECGQRDPDTAQPDGGDRWFEVVRDIIKDQDNAWWKTSGSRTKRPARPHRDQLLAAGHEGRPLRADRQARQGHRHLELGPAAPADPEEPDAGHRRPRHNAVAAQPRPVGPGRRRGRGRTPPAGTRRAVTASSWVPSMRMVVNLGDLDKSRWINLTGASGHAYNAHYTDQTDKWAKGELLPWSFSEKAVKESTEDSWL